ncbi:Zinc finger and SCAN domain-containing protein 22 [Exaiptasia diaphana]|nr:Zinc finger and SCAN domain-containing protein 22 [Exaiptasia diaphana]
MIAPQLPTNNESQEIVEEFLTSCLDEENKSHQEVSNSLEQSFMELIDLAQFERLNEPKPSSARESQEMVEGFLTSCAEQENFLDETFDVPFDQYFVDSLLQTSMVNSCPDLFQNSVAPQMTDPVPDVDLFQFVQVTPEAIPQQIFTEPENMNSQQPFNDEISCIDSTEIITFEEEGFQAVHNIPEQVGRGAKRALEENQENNPPKKKLRCSQCEKDFASTCDLKRHEDTHFQAVHNIPEQVGRGTKRALEEIQENNPPKKKFRCSKCEKEFCSKCTLNRHEKIHSEKNFECSYCPMKFHRKSHKQLHKSRIHSQQRKCMICGEEFNDKKSYNQHIRHAHRGAKRQEASNNNSEQSSTKPNSKSQKNLPSRAPFPVHEDPRNIEALPVETREQSSTKPNSKSQKNLPSRAPFPVHEDPRNIEALPVETRGDSEVYSQNWNHIRTRFRRGNRLADSYNFRLYSRLPDELLHHLDDIFNDQNSVFKINVAFGFILRNNETNELPYYYTSRNNNPFLINPLLLPQEPIWKT